MEGQSLTFSNIKYFQKQNISEGPKYFTKIIGVHLGEQEKGGGREEEEVEEEEEEEELEECITKFTRAVAVYSIKEAE